MALDFDGTDDILEHASLYDFTSESFTLAAWVYIDDLTSGAGFWFKNEFQARGWYCQSDSAGKLYLVTNQIGAAQLSFSDNGAVTTGAWIHVGCSRTGATGKVWVNGVNVTTTSGSHVDPTTTSHRFVVGDYDVVGSHSYLNGRMANMGVWSVALDDAEFAMLAAKRWPGSVRPGSLIDHFPLGGASPGLSRRTASSALTVSGPVVADGPRVAIPRRLHAVTRATKTYSAVIRATNAGGTDDATVDFTVGPPRATVAYSDASGEAGTSFNITPTTAGTITSYAQTSGTALSTFGLTLNTLTGAITGTGVDSSGPRTIGITAYGPWGASDEDTFVLTVTGVPGITIPQTMPHARFSQTGNSGARNFNIITPGDFDPFAEDLLTNHVDVVDLNEAYQDAARAIRPSIPIGYYSNLGNIYPGYLQLWTEYSDGLGGTAAEKRARRELAFLHVTEEFAGTSNGGTTQPVTWFWMAYKNSATDVTTDSYDGDGVVVGGTMGNTLDLGMLDRFDRVVVNIGTGASGGWVGTWKYWDGNSWEALTVTTDGTSAMTADGTVIFNVPSDWTPSTINGFYGYFVRLETTTGGTGPDCDSITGEDYCGAGLTFSGDWTIPAFDYASDTGTKGYLTPAEYAGRAAGKNARFEHHARLFAFGYGQSRYVTRVANSTFLDWAGEFHADLINNTGAVFIAMDNGGENMNAYAGLDIVETGDLADGDREQDYADALSSVRADMVASLDAWDDMTAYVVDDRVKHDNAGWMCIANDTGTEPGTDEEVWVSSHWIMSNVSGANNNGTNADPTFVAGHFGFDEFRAKGTQHTTSTFGDYTSIVAHRLALGANTVQGIDTHPDPLGPRDARTGIANYAEVAMALHPTRLFVAVYGGAWPASNWDPTPAYAAWSAVTAYTGAEYVFHGGAPYKSTAAATNKEPGVAGDWDDYWDRLDDEGHWWGLFEHDLGDPVDDYESHATGADPDPLAPGDAVYTVFRREFENVWVLYKPISVGTGDTRTSVQKIANATSTSVSFAGLGLSGNTGYPLDEHGVKGAGVTSYNLRNGEGVFISKTA